MRGSIQPNDRFMRYYFYFIQERMNIFWRKLTGEGFAGMWSPDMIFNKYKFTNVYRCTDRVSQYLIREIIYSNNSQFTKEDILLRILIFKIFNKIETWEYLNQTLDEPLTISNFKLYEICNLLTERQKHVPIFNNAYMMTGSHSRYNHLRTKHEKWLAMVAKEFIEGHIPEQILEANNLEKIYSILRNVSFLGDFLAYQYTIDFNYSPFLNLPENGFVKAGIGAIRGIKKCFSKYGNCYEDAIKYVDSNFEILQRKYGFTDFRPLPNHSLELIDLQNCFCETDKYLRAKCPDFVIDNVRIKQRYKESPSPIYFFFPPQWKITLTEKCTKPRLKELTLF